MKQLLQYVYAIAFAVLSFAALRHFFPSPPDPETAQLQCSFERGEESKPAVVPISGRSINTIELNAVLSGRSVGEGIELWHAGGLARFDYGSQKIMGTIFLSPRGKVQGLFLFRDGYRDQADDVYIATLNDGGILDSNERSAFVFFKNAPDKLAHPFDYRCIVSQNRTQ